MHTELALAYNFSNEKDGKNIDADDGLLASAILPKYEGWFNQTVLQYGTVVMVLRSHHSAQVHTTTVQTMLRMRLGYRLLNWGVVSLGSDWEMGHQLALWWEVI